MRAENEPEQPHTPIEGTEHVAVRNLETQKRRRKRNKALRSFPRKVGF